MRRLSEQQGGIMAIVSRSGTVLSALLFATACGGPPSVPPAELPLSGTATIREIMDAMIDPSADYLFEAVSTVSDERGIVEKAPRTDEEWQEARRHAIMLLEAPGLLVSAGRRVARPEEVSISPDVALGPSEIQALIDAAPAAFASHASGLQDAARVAIEAIDRRNKDALFAASEGIDRACESCHLRYWYPNDQRAQDAFRQQPQ